MATIGTMNLGLSPIKIIFRYRGFIRPLIVDKKSSFTIMDGWFYYHGSFINLLEHKLNEITRTDIGFSISTLKGYALIGKIITYFIRIKRFSNPVYYYCSY